MKELFYFSNSDLMIQVQYVDELNSLRYSSHRRITEREREFVEQYILENVAVGNSKVIKGTAVVNYIGINEKLAKELNQVQRKAPKKESTIYDRKIEKSVGNLIQTSMSTYYFEQIGSKLIEIKSLEETKDTKKICALKGTLEELIDAYNHHTKQAITVEEILSE